MIFGAVSVPTENSLLPQFVNDSEDESESNGHSYLNKGSPAYTSLNGVVYNIRDKDFICALSIKSQREILNPGTSITISLQFEGSIQPCRSVRAYLQQCENRINGSRVQVGRHFFFHIPDFKLNLLLVLIILEQSNKNMMKFMIYLKLFFTCIETSNYNLLNSSYIIY